MTGLEGEEVMGLEEEVVTGLVGEGLEEGFLVGEQHTTVRTGQGSTFLECIGHQHHLF